MTRSDPFIPHTYPRPTTVDLTVGASEWFLYEDTDIPEGLTLVEYRRRLGGPSTAHKRRRFLPFAAPA